MATKLGPNKILTELDFLVDAGSTRSYPGSGTTVTNLLGTANGTLQNGVGFSTANGGNFEFDGSNDKINLGIGTGLNQFAAASNFSISVWAKRTAGSSYGTLVGDYYTGSVGTTNQWQVMMGPASQLNFYRVGTGSLFGNVASGVSNGTWVNVVVTRVGGIVKMYSNGVVIGTVSNNSTYGTSAGNLHIGIDGNGSSEPHNGKIASVQISNSKGLLADEVLQNYKALKNRFI